MGLTLIRPGAMTLADWRSIYRGGACAPRPGRAPAGRSRRGGRRRDRGPRRAGLRH